MSTCFKPLLFFTAHPRFAKHFSGRLRISTSLMSYRPNYRGGRRGGGARGGRGSRGGGAGGGGGQRWWDPAWRAERLRQMQGEVISLNKLNCSIMFLIC